MKWGFFTEMMINLLNAGGALSAAFARAGVVASVVLASGGKEHLQTVISFELLRVRAYSCVNGSCVGLVSVLKR